MQSLEVCGYTRQQIVDALHASRRPRVVKFRYDLLDKNEIKKATLQTVQSGEIDMQYEADIKRTAKFKIEDDGSINWLSDRIQPFFMLGMPDGGWAEWPLGIFLLSTPTRQDANGKIYRDVEAYDGLQILKDDKVTARYTITAGAGYIAAVTVLLTGTGITKINLQQTGKTLPTDKEYDPGTEKLKIVNDLLADLNYTPLWVDEIGFYTSQAYQSPQVRAPSYTYQDDELSVTYNGMQDTLDLFSVPNSWVMVLSNSESPPLISSYTNSNPSSPTSTASRGRTIVDYGTVDSIADQAALDAKVLQKAFEASQIYGKLELYTAVMPMHSYNDVLQINYSPLSIADKYSETGWSLPLAVGAKMKHECRRVVQI